MRWLDTGAGISNKSARGIMLVLVFAWSFNTQLPAQDSAAWQHGVVAADHQAASRAGLEILERGGNVVDAAVATSFALSVVRPASCGIGGGGFMLIWDATRRKAVALDYRERAPATASRDMFREAVVTESSESPAVRGGQAVAVPGTVAGLCYAAEHYGTLPLKDLLAPAIRLARHGVQVDAHDNGVQRTTLGKLTKYEGYLQKYSLLRQRYLNNGQTWGEEAVFRSPQLATLELIARDGAAAFYEGVVAAAIVNAVKDAGGEITREDLESTKPVVRSALTGQFHDFDVWSMPPASSGGTALLQTLQTLEHWEQQQKRSLEELQHNSSAYIHVVVEAMKHAFADRAEFMGDADFVDLPLKRLLSSDYAAQMARKIDDKKTLPSNSYGRFFLNDDGGTSHFSIIDAAGNAVACTETINLTFGSFVVVPEYGIVLNNQIDDFAARPGEPNAFGLLQSEANAIAPGKKPLSSMTPTIVIRDGRAVFASGASGGPRIISATIQATLNHVVFGMTPAKAVSAPRFHHQWFPNELLLEPALFDRHAESLRKLGHSPRVSSSIAANQSVSADTRGLMGGSDPRKHGVAAGY